MARWNTKSPGTIERKEHTRTVAIFATIGYPNKDKRGINIKDAAPVVEVKKPVKNPMNIIRKSFIKYEVIQDRSYIMKKTI
ncbi:hypothetical protein GAMM_60184 [Gammaproteobacteria bacterium]